MLRFILEHLMYARSVAITLVAIKEALREELSADSAFSFINTRLILRTGVDLNRADLTQVSPDRLARVKKELLEMGYLKGLLGE